MVLPLHQRGRGDLSPSPRLFVTQIGLEPVLLRRRGATRGADRVRVRGRLGRPGRGRRDGGRRDRETAAPSGRSARSYVVAADGAHSPVRERLGIGMRGPRQLLGQHHHLLPGRREAADRRPQPERRLRLRPAAAGLLPLLASAGEAGFLVVNSTTDDDGTRTTAIGEDMSEETLRRATCARRSAPRTSRSRSRTCSAGTACAEWAERFADGPRVPRRRRGPRDAADRRLRRQHRRAGRAQPRLEARARARRHAPAPALLDTYDAERRPVGEFTAEQAYTRYVLRLDPTLGKENLEPIVDDAADRARLPATARTPSRGARRRRPVWEDPREPTGRPGFRAPHLGRGRRGRRSTLDLFGRGFVVLGGLGRRAVARRRPRRRRGERHRRRDVSRRRRAHGRRRRRRGALRHRHRRRGAHPAGRFRRVADECGRSRRASTRARRGTRPLRVPAPSTTGSTTRP